jgi:hypothetical protein
MRIQIVIYTVRELSQLRLYLISLGLRYQSSYEGASKFQGEAVVGVHAVMSP